MAPRKMFSAALALLAIQACGGSEADPRTPCQEAQECGSTGEVLCLENFCYPYDPGMGQATLRLDLSFGRDMVEVAYSSRIHVLWPFLADGTALTCAELTSRARLPEDAQVNPMLASPRFIRLNWSGTGTIFPGILIQFVWPGTELLVVAEGFYQADGSGLLTAIGCLQGLALEAGQTTEATVTMMRAP